MIYEFIKSRFSHFNLNEEETIVLVKILRFKRFRRKEIIFHFGERVHSIALLVEGSAFSRTLCSDGNDQILSFHYPTSIGEIVFNYDDYIQGNLSQKIYQAYEDSLLLFLDVQAVKQLYAKYPKFYQLELMIMEPNLVHALQNIRILQANSAEEKIRLLKDYYPKIFQVFPYQYIASYLGIHRNTFNNALGRLK